MKKTKNIELKGNFLNIRKDFLRTSFIIFIGLILLVAAIVLVVRDSPFDKAMNEIDKADLEMDKALAYVSSGDYNKAEISFYNSMDYIEDAMLILEKSNKELSEKQQSAILDKTKIIFGKGVTVAFGIGFGELANIFN